ncbi:hypothetical protein HYQ46_010105 [Verticillium longisporum]|nr:hypothetical protein HYQ46_010105 [Verticillium longisporum]
MPTLGYWDAWTCVSMKPGKKNWPGEAVVTVTKVSSHSRRGNSSVLARSRLQSGSTATMVPKRSTQTAVL